MQGTSLNPSARIRTAASFAAAFLCGAVLAFAVASAVGTRVTSDVPDTWRAAVAGAGLLSLAAVDLAAVRRRRYCPIGWRRQTPRMLLRRHRVDVVAAVWGFDTGLAFTTVRVAAVTWGALLLALLGLSPAWAGLGYGLGFVGPFLVLLWRSRVGPASRSAAPADPGLEAMLGRRALLQRGSAAVLAAAGSVLVGTAVVTSGWVG